MTKPATNGKVGHTSGADATVAADRSEQADAEWFRRLCTGSNGARVLQNHLASIESRLDSNGALAAIDQAVHNREAFLATLHHSLVNNAPFPCGLASRIPKYVAIVNLSGKRLLLTSDNDILVRALCARSSRSTSRALAEQIHRFVLWVECALSPVTGSVAPTTAFVLITYSLPWQAGLDAAYWEVNTAAISTRDDGKRLVMDRHISLSSLSNDTFSARPTLSARAIDDATRGAFAVQYVATNLDAHDYAHVADDEDAEGAKIQRLRSVMEAMRAQTSKEREEIGTWKATVKIRNLLYGRSIAKADLKALKAEEEANRLRTTVQKLLIESSDASKRADEAQRQVEKLRRQEGAKDKLTNAATAKQSNALRRLTGQLEASQRAAAEEREEARRAHEREREAIVARASQERAALQTALQFKERALNQLAEANDARSLDLEAARFELARVANERAARDVAASALCAELVAAEGATDALRAELAAVAEAAVATPTTPTTPTTVETSVATESRGTATHHHGTTQTSDARIFAEDLPESMRASLLEPSHASAPPAVAPPAVAPPVMAQPVTMPMTQPPPTTWTMGSPCSHAPCASPQPFGTPQMAMSAVRFNLANLMNWTTYLEGELAQVAAMQCCEPRQFGTQPFTAPPKGPPRRGRTAR